MGSIRQQFPEGSPGCRGCRRWVTAELWGRDRLCRGSESPEPLPAPAGALRAHGALTRGEAVPGGAAGPGRAGRGRPLGLSARGRGAPPGRLLRWARRCRLRGLGPEGLAELLHQAVHAVCRDGRARGEPLGRAALTPPAPAPTQASLTARHGPHGRAGDAWRGRSRVPLLAGARRRLGGARLRAAGRGAHHLRRGQPWGRRAGAARGGAAAGERLPRWGCAGCRRWGSGGR